MITPDQYKKSGVPVSGRILNCVTQLPGQIFRTHDKRWDVKSLRGSSALYASNKYLQTHTDWETHLIGWTGELYEENETVPRSIPEAQKIENDPLYLSNEDKQNVEDQIKSNDLLYGKASAGEEGPARIHAVWLLRKDQDRWRQYAENVLWPVLHYQLPEATGGNEQIQWWTDYVKFNEAYAAKVRSIYKPGDIIWVHDYYLLLLPQILRMEIPDSYIVHFLHVPFPSSEYFRCLSKRQILLDGLLGANQVGFQSFSFCRHFLSCCTRLLGYDVNPKCVFVHSAKVLVDAFPLGVDVAMMSKNAFVPEVTAKVSQLKKLTSGCKLIVGRDRLDSVHGVVQKLEAFNQFLELFPRWVGHVVLIQVSYTPPTLLPFHTSTPAKKVAELVTKINGRYGTLDYTPVLHYRMPIPRSEYLALLRAADICLVTCVRDGMNTTALEYIVCQKENAAPLVLSEFSGAASLLPDSYQVNPWDTVGVARTLNDCLLLPEERRKVVENRCHDSVCKHSVQHWTEAVLKSLLESLMLKEHNNEDESLSDNNLKVDMKDTSEMSIDGMLDPNEALRKKERAEVKESLATSQPKSGLLKPTPYLNKPLLLQCYNSAVRKRLFLFDYDGTLTPIVKDPSAAIPSARLLSLLSDLLNDQQNVVWIVSGRDQKFLEKWFGARFPALGLSAEHGCFVKPPGSTNWTNLVAKMDLSWQRVAEGIFEYFTEITPGSFIEKKKVAITWHYRKASPDIASFHEAECFQKLEDELSARDYDVTVIRGKANVEVRPLFANKGEIARRLILCEDPTVQRPKMRASYMDCPEFVLCLGDDTTDEDMFRALNAIAEKWHEENVPLTDNRALDSYPYGLFPVTVGPANKYTVAKAYLSDPKQVLDTLGMLLGQVSIFDTAGSVELDDRGHVINSASARKSLQNRRAWQQKRLSDSKK